MTFTRITHQFTLWDYNQMRPSLKVPITRISRARMEEVMRQRQFGNNRPLVNVLRDLNDDLEIYCKQKGIL